MLNSYHHHTLDEGISALIYSREACMYYVSLVRMLTNGNCGDGQARSYVIINPVTSLCVTAVPLQTSFLLLFQHFFFLRVPLKVFYGHVLSIIKQLPQNTIRTMSYPVANSSSSFEDYTSESLEISYVC